jgi:hypothetical protein
LTEVSGQVDRKLIRKELNTEALFLSGFTEAQIMGLGDLGEISTDRLHELLWSKLGEALYRATTSHHAEVVTLHPKKRSRVRPEDLRKARSSDFLVAGHGELPPFRGDLQETDTLVMLTQDRQS